MVGILTMDTLLQIKMYFYFNMFMKGLMDKCLHMTKNIDHLYVFIDKNVSNFKDTQNEINRMVVKGFVDHFYLKEHPIKICELIIGMAKGMTERFSILFLLFVFFLNIDKY